VTEAEARARFVDELLRHERFIRDGGYDSGSVHDSRGLVYEAEKLYRTVATYEFCLRHGDRAALRARMSLDLYDAMAEELTPKDGGG
jgi:hypothetical protein